MRKGVLKSLGYLLLLHLRFCTMFLPPPLPPPPPPPPPPPSPAHLHSITGREVSHDGEFVSPVLDAGVAVEVAHQARHVLQHQGLATLASRPILVAVPAGVPREKGG